MKILSPAPVSSSLSTPTLTALHSRPDRRHWPSYLDLELEDLTTPPPTFAQVWHWKRNVQAGLLLFATKRAAAVTYLTQSGRTATDDQIKYETVYRSRRRRPPLVNWLTPLCNWRTYHSLA